MNKVFFIGNFDENYWLKKHPNEFGNYKFVDKVIVTEALFFEYDLAFVYDRKLKRLAVFCECNTHILINIKKGTPDECADSFINCNNGFIGIDISDIVNALRGGEQPPEYYASLSLEEILRSNELYASKKGIVLFIHAPTNANLEDVDTHCAQICDLCSEDAVVLWNILIDKEIHEYLFDVFVSGNCGEIDKLFLKSNS